MSLADAVLAIADDMVEQAGKEGDDVDLASVCLRMYARQLRIAVKASAGQPQQAMTVPNFYGPQTSENNPHIAAARAEFRKQKEEARVREAGGLVRLVGAPGTDDKVETMIPVDEPLKVGAMPVIDGKVWLYQHDGKLHYQAEETEKYLKSTGKK